MDSFSHGYLRGPVAQKRLFLDHLLTNDYHLSSGGPNPVHRLREGAG
jgi:hypothetical protein